MTEALENSFTEEERRRLMARLYDLLRAQTERYLAGESTSVAAETAEELFRSLLYTLRLALSETGRPERALLTEDPDALLREGQRALQRKLAESRRLWQQACATAPRIHSRCYEETLTEFGKFFRRYDLRYFAARIPCSVDYPLCVPVPEKLQGVSYAEVWLRRLLTENHLLGRFPEPTAEDLLKRESPDFRNSPFNLCEQPAVNALGLALVGKPVFDLVVTEQDCARLQTLCGAEGALDAALPAAAEKAASQLAATEEAADYLQKIAAGLRPRLASALAAGDVRAVFCVSAPDRS